MTAAELKEKIENESLSNDFLILLCSENHFVADQYVEAIAKNAGLTLRKINSIYEPSTSALSLVIDYESSLNVLVVDTFEEFAQDYSKFLNTVVICDKIDKKIEPNVKDFVVKIPALEDWCIQDYIKLICPKFDDESALWLYKGAAGNIYRIINELDKITLFDQNEQLYIFNELRSDPETDLYYIKDIFTVATYIAQRNRGALSEYLRHIKENRFSALGIVTNLLNKVKLVLYSQRGSGVNLKALGSKVSGQAYYATQELRGVSLESLGNMLEFLSNIEIRIKSGELDLTENQLIDYVITHIFAC